LLSVEHGIYRIWRRVAFKFLKQKNGLSIMAGLRGRVKVTNVTEVTEFGVSNH